MRMFIFCLGDKMHGLETARDPRPYIRLLPLFILGVIFGVRCWWRSGEFVARLDENRSPAL